MSKRKREAIESGLGQNRLRERMDSSSDAGSVEETSGIWRSLGKMERIFAIGLVALLSLSVFGFVGSRISSSFSSSSSAESGGSVAQNSANPNSSALVTTSATPQLSKEYIYAGSRMLAVEDANANAAPPADLAVWRPSTGTWYVLGGPGSTQTFFPWGASTDKTAPGDYDGDGKTDFSVFRPSTNQWWIYKSSDNTYYALTFGASGDLIAQADYDGDGKTDAAVFRPSTGFWYIQPSGGSGFYGAQFGASGDAPAPADYDGDGKADIGVWRNSDTNFYSANSSNGAVITTSLGISSGKPPVSGDYDGDGRADFAIRSGNNWVIKNSTNGSTSTIPWESENDTAVQNDYDGDGKVDIAVWKSTGVWKILKSSNEQTRTENWGMAGDIPVPAYYRR